MIKLFILYALLGCALAAILIFLIVMLMEWLLGKGGYGIGSGGDSHYSGGSDYSSFDSGSSSDFGGGDSGGGGSGGDF